MAVNRAVSSHAGRLGLARGHPYGLRDHTAGPAVQQCHVGEVHRLRR